MDPEKINKYAFIASNPWGIRALYIFGIISWTLTVYGFTLFLDIDPVYWITIAPLLALFTTSQFLTYAINLFYKPFDVPKHNMLVKEYWGKIENPPTVDIFLPICGEDIRILNNTFSAVSDMRHKKRQEAVRVYALDDKGDSDVEALAKLYGFTYLSRENKGHMKKAGNLDYGYNHSNGELIVIFDADFAPHPDFLKELIPYMKNPRIAIVQSPQYFQVDDIVHKRSALEYGAGYVQEDFYKIIQVAHNSFGSPICVGSNAVYRRAALEDVGGFAQIEHSEDIYTGYSLLAKGWKLRYVPLILAVGLCPDNMQSFIHQQVRWASGNVTLFWSKDFWSKKIRFMQRLGVVSGFLYYFTHIGIIIMSFQPFILLMRHPMLLEWQYTLLFVPFLVFVFILMPASRLSSQKRGVFLTQVVQHYTYAYAILLNLFGLQLQWQSTNSKKKGVSTHYIRIIMLGILVFALYAAAFTAAAITIIELHGWDALHLSYILIFGWLLYFLAINTLFLTQIIRDFLPEKAKQQNPALAFSGNKTGK